ncbi:MAG: UDP-N-acetyl-D-mannosamine dehydrogenase [Pseudomonadota bacterium]
MRKKSVCVVGLGYIGLPTGALLAASGFEVMGVDLNAQTVDTINQGRVHIVEPDLDAYVRSAVSAGKLKAFTTPQKADVYMICVPTPFHEGEGIPTPNIDYVLAATRSVAPLLEPGNLLILESTSPVGTTAEMGEVIKTSGIDISGISIAYCPERVLPGKIMKELVENDRVVGGLTPDSGEAVAAFYRTFVNGEVLITDAATAEMCKLAENSFRDVNIAFANELSLICAKSGIDVWRLIGLANRHPRVNIMQPGAGVGGHCIAVDPWFIVASDPLNARLIRTAREVNDHKTDWVIEKICRAAEVVVAREARPVRIACLGLAFKPDIDDLRESPAVHVATALKSKGFDVVAVEPNIETHPLFQLSALGDALADADIVAVLVKHKEFVAAMGAGALSGKSVMDFCGLNS